MCMRLLKQVMVVGVMVVGVMMVMVMMMTMMVKMMTMIIVTIIHILITIIIFIILDVAIHNTSVHTLCRNIMHSTDADCETPMHKAAAASNSLLVACLARVGCSVASLSRDGSTPLALSVRGGDAECVKACACGHDAKEAAFVVDKGSGR